MTTGVWTRELNATNTGFVETAKAKIILGVDLVNF